MRPELWNEIEVRPAFFDLDPLAVVYHGNYVRYFELARSALLQKLGYDYAQMRESGYLWPVVDMRVKFIRPATLHQALRVRAEVVEWENRLKVQYRISDGDSGHRLTTGFTIQVAVDAKTMEMQYVSPRVLWAKLGVEP